MLRGGRFCVGEIEELPPGDYPPPPLVGLGLAMLPCRLQTSANQRPSSISSGVISESHWLKSLKESKLATLMREPENR